MQEKITIQGRSLGLEDIVRISEMITAHPEWHRSKLSQELCRSWDWRNGKGILKDIACRSLLRKLESKGYIVLPPQRHVPKPRMKGTKDLLLPLPFYSQANDLPEAQPLKIEIVEPKTIKGKLFDTLLVQYHYLGYKGSVGEHLPYLIWDQKENVLGCILFGAAAWRIAPRDQFIGWNEGQRQRNLPLIANNMRFLLLKKIPHLASHLLGKIAQRISRDWEEKYGHPIVLLETFVEVGRFAGTCYRAANWSYVGKTQGRSRNDRYSKLKVPIKGIYLYPLIKDFRKVLCS